MKSNNDTKTIMIFDAEGFLRRRITVLQSVVVSKNYLEYLVPNYSRFSIT